MSIPNHSVVSNPGVVLTNPILTHSMGNSPAANQTVTYPQTGPHAPSITFQYNQAEALKSNDRHKKRLLPVNHVTRSMERALPPVLKVHKDAAIMLRDMITEFIGFTTCECADRLVEDHRQALTAEDVIDTIRALGFSSDYTDVLEHALCLSYYGGSLVKRQKKHASYTPGDDEDDVDLDDEQFENDTEE